ncbi:MAG: hypothetical protein MJZ99_11220 [Bacteroidales bacterium]|nr:hypothetical protein [Bacteroidales bacterium]
MKKRFKIKKNLYLCTLDYDAKRPIPTPAENLQASGWTNSNGPLAIFANPPVYSQQ